MASLPNDEGFDSSSRGLVATPPLSGKIVLVSAKKDISDQFADTPEHQAKRERHTSPTRWGRLRQRRRRPGEPCSYSAMPPGSVLTRSSITPSAAGVEGDQWDASMPAVRRDARWGIRPRV